MYRCEHCKYRNSWDCGDEADGGDYTCEYGKVKRNEG